MPYSSDAQRRWAHTAKGKEALGGPKKVDEWDQASKGMDLPEKVKMADGGKVEDKTWAEKLGDYLASKHGTASSDRNEAEIAAHIDEPVGTSTGTASGYKDGGIVETIKNTAENMHKNYSKTQDEGYGNLKGFENMLKNRYEVQTSTEPKKMADGGEVDSDFMNQLNQGIDTTPPPAEAPVLDLSSKFNPKAGLPPAPQMPLQQPKSPILAPQPGPSVTPYLEAQKASLNKYGPEQQMALQQQLQQKYGGLQGKGAVALGGLADAIMQGVARAGSSNFGERIQGQQNADINRQLETMQKAREGNVQNVELQQKLDAMDPKSALSKSVQASQGMFLAALGFDPKTIGQMSAAQIPEAISTIKDLGIKDREIAVAKYKAQIEANQLAETTRQHKVEAGLKGQELAETAKQHGIEAGLKGQEIQSGQLEHAAAQPLMARFMNPAAKALQKQALGDQTSLEEHQTALDWAASHPNDPRAARIKSLHGMQ